MKNHTRFFIIFTSLFIIFCTILSTNLSVIASASSTKNVEEPHAYFDFGLFPDFETRPIQFEYLDTKAKVTYRSNDTSIATVSKKGYVKGVAVGSTSIHVKIIQNSKTYEQDVPVRVHEPVINMRNEPATLALNSSYPLTCITYGAKKFKFIATSSNPEIIKVNTDLTVTAVSIGTATITITDTINKKSYSFDSTVISQPDYENKFIQKYTAYLYSYLGYSEENNDANYFGLQDINQDGYLDLILDGSIYGSDLNLNYDIYYSLVAQTLMLSKDGTYLKVTTMRDGKEVTTNASYYKLEGNDFVLINKETSTDSGYKTAKYVEIETPYKITSKNIKNLRKLLKLDN